MNVSTPPEQLRFLRVKEACSILGIGRTTLYHLIKAGHINIVRMGPRAIRIPPQEVDRLRSQGGID